jgi:hypothetical protein
MPPAFLSSVFDLDRIQKLAGVRVLARASMIPEGDIENRTEDDSRLSAVVQPPGVDATVAHPRTERVAPRHPVSGAPGTIPRQPAARNSNSGPGGPLSARFSMVGGTQKPWAGDLSR